MKHEAFVIRLADVNIGIEPLHGFIAEYCRDYITQEIPAFTVATTQADLDLERRKSEAEDAQAGRPLRPFSDAYLETLSVYRKIAAELLNRDILLYHGSCIAVDGEGYLFTAKSGTGKSTHVGLWRRQFGNRAVTINDDKPLLAVTASGIWACGTPWNGKHRLSANICCRLKAICILERSDTNRIRRITAKEGYAALLQQAHRPTDPQGLSKTLQVLDKILSQVALYRLGCNMDPAAAIVSYRGMNGEA